MVLLVSLRRCNPPNCPKDLSLTFYDNGLCDKGYAALANALENNLSVTVQGVMRANTRLDAYNCRNNFIRQYPQHENFIKKMCYERGFYKASPECQQTPASLKSLAGRRLLLNTNRDTLEEQRKFPQEIHEFLKELDAISDTLTSTPQPIM